MIARDLQHGVRLLAKSPGFATLAILTIALAVGANTAVFSIVDAWLWRPLAFDHPERIVTILGADLRRPTEPAYFAFYRDYLAWRERSQTLERCAAVFYRSYLLTGHGHPEEFTGLIATADLFHALGVEPVLGRSFNAADVDGPPVVVLSHAVWQRRFGGSPAAIGQRIRLNSIPYEIIGVLPKRFDLRMLNSAAGDDIFALLQPSRDREYQPGQPVPVAVVARLRPGITPAQAQAELNTLSHEVEAGYHDLPKDIPFGVVVSTVQAGNSRGMRATLVLLLAAVGFLLLIACTNLAGLLVARGLRRRREYAIRAALGSSRRRLIAQSLVESLVLALAGGIAGTLVAFAAVRLFVAADPLGALPINPIAIDARALAFTLTVTLLATMLFGLAPALRTSRPDLCEALKNAGARASEGAHGRRMQWVMLTAQVGLTVALLVGTSLMVETFVRLTSAPLGFRVESVTLARLVLPAGEFPDRDARARFYAALEQRLSALPGVRTAAVSHSLPVWAGENQGGVQADDAGPDQAHRMPRQSIGPRWFHALSVPVLRGRVFRDTDTAASEPVAALNQTAARRLFGGRDPIGRRVRISDDSQWRTVVAVVADTRSQSPGRIEWDVRPRLYMPYRQAPDPRVKFGSPSVIVLIRAATPPSIEAIRHAVEALSPDIAVGSLEPMTQAVADAVRQPRFRTVLLAVFAALALFLAAIGIYGAVSQSVADRTHEIGIRMAVGASPAAVRRMVLRQALAVAAIGLSAGTVASLLLAQTMASIIYGARPTRAITFAAAWVILGAVTLIAAFAPGRTASRIDPLSALRGE